MKRVFKIIALTLLCVIGVFGLGIGGMYLFGGFDEKIVYADNLYFSETEKISSETIFMQVNTSTEGVTRSKLKLVASYGGERIINFPEEIEIGKPFTITPIRQNGKNVGGNVTLTAYYDSVDANLSAIAKCNILIDVPVESVNVKMSSLVLKPGGQITPLCSKDDLISSSLDIAPLNSLTPYIISGTQQINSFTDKKIFLELCNTNGNPLSDNNPIATFRVNNSSDDKKATVEVKYEVKDINSDGRKEVVFSDNIYIISGNKSEDVILKAYTYSTYKKQEENTLRDDGGNITEVVLDKNQTLQTDMGFSIGTAEAVDMTFDSANKKVYLGEEVRIYLNTEEKNLQANDINLGLELVSDSAGIPIGDYRLLENICLDISNPNYRTLKNGNDIDDEIYTADGLKINYLGISTQKDEWYWSLKINSFEAYYNYKNNEETLLATITYREEENAIVKTFKIIPAAYEVDSITTVYEEGNTAIKAQSGSALNFSDDSILLNTYSLPQGVEPTFTDLEHYISYDKNYYNGATTVNITPTQAGKYKAEFYFNISKVASSFSIVSYSSNWAIFESVVFTQGGKTYTITYNNGVPQNPVVSPVGAIFDDVETPVKAQIMLQIKQATTSKDLFYITTDENITITNTMVKFYETISSGEGVETTYSTTPYLTINKIRFYVDFEPYKDEKTNIQYLRIIDRTATSDFMKVQGIGSFYITTQLVYIDENTKQIYWLGKSVDTKIDVIELLTNLSAYKYDVGNDTYNNAFGTDTISYKEGNAEEEATYYYIFITSTTMESLKNYVIYNQINIVVRQKFGSIIVENYPGIESINANAIEFVSDWVEVIDNDKVVGYKIAYKINPISTISVDGTIINNIFNISIYVNVDEKTQVFAKFILDTTTGYDNPKSLDVTIEDKTIQTAKIVYGSTENPQSNPLEVKANVQNQEVVWSNINFEDNLKYYFGYSQDATEGITDSMTYDISVVDSSKVVLTNLYNFKINNTGKGGLVLKNFPVNLDESGKNQGVLLKITVYSLGVYDFNSHYEWNAGLANFVQTQNSNLSADLYIKVYGLELNIEANKPEVFGIKDAEDKIGTDTAGIPFIGTDGLFKITAKSGSGSEIYIDDYSKVMSVFMNNETLSLNETSTRLYFQKDFLVDQNVQFIFYIGSNANRIRIKTGVDGQTDIYQTYYDQLIKSAYTVEVSSSFVAPSSNQSFATITYNGAPEVQEGAENSFDINSLLTISVEVKSTTLSEDYNITQPILVDTATNLLTFKTVPTEYFAVIRLSLTKKDGTNASDYKDYNIKVLPIYSNDDLTIGTLYDSEQENSDYYYILAGKENLISTVNGGIVYNNELNNTKANISSVDIIFANKQQDNIDTSAHMGKVIKIDELQIWSYDLNYSKTITITLTFNYVDKGKFIYTKDLTINPNMTLQLKNNQVNSNVTSINLTNTSSYLLTKNGEEIALEMPDFVYDSTDTNYNKNTFTFDSNVLMDISSTTADDQDFLLKPVINSLQVGGITEKTIIRFKYIVADRGYSLTYDLPLYITYVSSAYYSLNFNTEFNCATENQKLFNIIYSGGEEDTEVKDYSGLLSVEITNISTSLSSEYGIASPITVNSNTNLLTFKTVPVEYTAVISVKFTTLTGTQKTITQDIEITVNPIYTQSDITLGELNANNPNNTYYFIKDGVDNLISTSNNKIVFANNLNLNKENIIGVNMTFVDATDETANVEYIKYSFESGVLKLWSEDLTENKEIFVSITFTFADGGNYTFNDIYLKVINV